jgi:hypothetical protein
MVNLDEEWQHILKEAEKRARATGQGDVAEYIALRATNDLARTTGVDWLISGFISLAGEANRAGACIEFSRNNSHQFQVGSSIMVGAQLILRLGLRSLTIEAGWPRKPSDGIVRGGGLARARVEHFGNGEMDQDLILLRNKAGLLWAIIDSTGKYTKLSDSHVRLHLKRLLR